jgi:UDP-glucuronate decarboxylase
VTLPRWLAERLARGDERFAVTGASGWFGLATLDLLFAALGPEAFAERVSAFASASRSLRVGGAAQVHARPLPELASLDPPPTHLLHYAYPTPDRVASLGSDAFLRIATDISLAVVAAISRGGLSGVFFTSSGAVYGRDGRLANDLAADPYGATKVLHELAVRQVCRDAGVTSVVARVFSVSGPSTTGSQLYALGDLVAQVLAGEPIRVRAPGPVLRSYVAITDVVTVALAELLEPSSPDLVFDTGGDEVIEIGDLARRVGAVLGRPDLPVLRRFDPLLAPDRYLGDPSALAALAARSGVTVLPLDEQIRRMAGR